MPFPGVTFGKPYKNVDEAAKARRSALLALCALTAAQAAIGLFLWWVSTQDLAVPNYWPNLDSIALFIIALVVYFLNSRIAAVALLALSALKFVAWIPAAMSTGNFALPGMKVLFAVVACQVAFTVFKTRSWNKANNVKMPPSTLITLALLLTFILEVAAFLIPPTHFWHYTRFEIKHVSQGDMIEYYDPLDKYSFGLPNTWTFDQPPLSYGSVNVSPSEDPDVTINIERWQPWSISPVTLFSRDAFLTFARNEAATYSTQNKAAIDSVDLVGPSNINEARVVYTEADGSKRYVYYLYDRGWSRQTSTSAFFFWRMTATVPKTALQQYDAVVQSILSSFKINASAPST
jgi:hypothetical protein